MTHNNKNTGIILIIAAVLIYLVYQIGGVPFLGALVLFEEGNEIRFTEEKALVTKEVDSEGQNITETIGAVTDESRFLTMESAYINSAEMRLYGTPGISNGKLTIIHNKLTQEVWTQTQENFSEIEIIDLTEVLSFNATEGETVIFSFHSDTPGSLIVSTFEIDWGPTNEQISLCESSGGTFDEADIDCDCPSDSTSFGWETGCIYPAQEDSITSGSYSAPIVSSPSSSATLTSKVPEFSIYRIAIVLMIIGTLIYYFGFEKGPKRGFIQKK